MASGDDVNDSATPTHKEGGRLPAWEVDDLPAPPPLGLRNAFKVIGPGAILLATAIGGGEWLVGPAATVRYGTGLLGIATIAIILQATFNMEAIRYTLYTGEPIFGGFLRLRPGPAFWATVYAIISIVHLAWPALALSAAGTLFSAFEGRVPGLEPGDTTLLHVLASAIVVGTALILLFGGTIEHTLEIASWLMLGYIFVFLVVVNVLFVPARHFLETLRGFLSLDLRSDGGRVDWPLLGALAMGAGAGGLGCLTISNWFRDKGFGMGAKVGAIASAVGGRATKLSPTGRVFLPTPENVRRFRTWWTYVHIDQVLVWALFCFVGIFLTTNLATGIIPQGTRLEGLATGAYQAEYLGKLYRPLFLLTLLNGFWILFSTQLGNTDLLVRTLTDILWMGSPRARRWSGDRPSRIYYAALALLSLWGLVAVHAAGPFALFKLLANVGAVLMVLGGVQILIVNNTFLPPALRPSRPRQAIVALAVLFYGFFVVRSLVHVL